MEPRTLFSSCPQQHLQGDLGPNLDTLAQMSKFGCNGSLAGPGPRGGHAGGVSLGDPWPRSAHPCGTTHTGKDKLGERPVRALEMPSGVLAGNSEGIRVSNRERRLLVAMALDLLDSCPRMGPAL